MGNKIAPVTRNKNVEHMRNRLISIDIVGLPFVCENRCPACPNAGGASILHCLEHGKNCRRDAGATETLTQLCRCGTTRWKSFNGAVPDCLIDTDSDGPTYTPEPFFTL